MRSHPARPAFTLVELLVVIAIIGVLVSITLPAVMFARETARKMSCSNNLRQTILALQTFELTYNRYPASWRPTKTGTSGWSAQAQLLPFLEEENVEQHIDYEQSYSNAPLIPMGSGSVPLSAYRVNAYLCPSDTEDHVRMNSSFSPVHYPVSYGANLGVWFVYDPRHKSFGHGSFRPLRGYRSQDIVDGLTSTIAFAEVKAFTPYFRNAALNSPPRPTPDTVPGLGGQFKTRTGHTEWVDGRVHQTGFTALFTPNTQVRYEFGGQTFDVDWTNQQEGKSATVATYAAVTSRSYHRGGVQVGMLGGNVTFITDEIDARAWHALATRHGGEPNPLRLR